METILENDVMVDKNILQNIDWDSLTFSLNPTRSMFVAECVEGGEWETGKLIPYGDVKISPAAGVLNYGQGVFEGIKAFRSLKDRIIFFRLDMNAVRFYRSCKRLCIPPIHVDMFMKAKSIDNVLTNKANKRISTYSKYFPSKEDCFFNDIEAGSSYKVGCWIGRSTRVRTRD